MSSSYTPQELQEVCVTKILSGTNIPKEVVDALFEVATCLDVDSDYFRKATFDYLGGTVEIAEVGDYDPADDVEPVLEALYEGAPRTVNDTTVAQHVYISYIYDPYTGCWTDPVKNTVGTA